MCEDLKERGRIVFDSSFLGLTLSDYFANDHRTGGNTDAHGKFIWQADRYFGIELWHRLDCRQTSLARSAAVS